jgi:uncharacterized protein
MKTNAGKPCPICGRPGLARWRPFCSQRCADDDLFRWLSGSYRIPGPAADEETDVPERPADEEH